MTNFDSTLVEYNRCATDYIKTHNEYKKLKAQKYLNLACPDPAVRPKDWKKPSDAIIEATLDTDPELNDLKLKSEATKLTADSFEWWLEYLSHGH